MSDHNPTMEPDEAELRRLAEEYGGDQCRHAPGDAFLSRKLRSAAEQLRIARAQAASAEVRAQEAIRQRVAMAARIAAKDAALERCAVALDESTRGTCTPDCGCIQRHAMNAARAALDRRVTVDDGA